MDKIALEVVALTNSESHPGNYALILEEQQEQRRLPIIIGSFEAQAIAVTLENMTPKRPLTHDLFKHTLDALQATLREVLIYELVDDTFFTRMKLLDASGQTQTVEARTSDAIALAVRFGCPIYTYRAVLDAAGFIIQPSGAVIRKGGLATYPIEELEALLLKVLAKEDYKSAARIQDVLDRRKKQ